MLFFQSARGVIVVLEEAEDGLVIQGAQMLHKLVTESVFGLTNVEEAKLGATDTVDQVGGCAGELLSDLESLSRALNGGEKGGVGADAAEAEDMRGKDHILAGDWVREGVVKVAMEFGGFDIDVGAETVTRDGDGDGDGEVPEAEGGKQEALQK
eukprot:g45958.t1